VAATLGNGGKYFRPRIVKKAVAEDGQIIIADLPKLEVDLVQSGVTPADIELIRKGMWMSVNQAGGTSGKVKHPTVSIAAKSGTAQSVDNGKPSNNSWIISFAPYENPKYAVCVLVQNGGSGGGVCGPLVNLIYRGIFARDHHGIRLPLKAQKEVIGNLDRLEAIEIPPETIAAIEAGDTAPSPDVVATAEISTTTSEASVGETGNEVVGLLPISPSTLSPSVTPTPTITPEVDAEGSSIPRAIPVKEH
jgi:penicillin-binding protein 2